MKAVGHVATAVIASAPVIYLSEKYADNFPDVFYPGDMSSYHQLWWVGLFAVLPDTDIILRKFLPIKHRGYFSHSIWTVLAAGGIVLALYLMGLHRIIPTLKFCTPYSAVLASFAVFIHLVGDSMTKTGVPLFKPNKAVHFPIIGGYAAFDNIFLNAIPVALAVYVVGATFGYNPKMLHYFGKFKDFGKVFTPE